MASIWAEYHAKNWPYQYTGRLKMDSIAGGFPADPKVMEGHLLRKVGHADDLIRQEVQEAAAEMGLSIMDAAQEVAAVKGLVRFRRDPEKGLWIPGNNLKACLREGASISAAAGRVRNSGWGYTSTNKGVLSWIAEHVFVKEHKLYLGVGEADEIAQSFVVVNGPKGPRAAIQYTEVVYDCNINFTLETDWNWDREDWAAIWTSCELNGLGAARKMGYGTFDDEQFDLEILATPRSRPPVKKADQNTENGDNGATTSNDDAHRFFDAATIHPRPPKIGDRRVPASRKAPR